MPFKRGQPRPANAGRKKGSSFNRATVAAILDQMGCDPIEGMVLLAMDQDNKPELRGRLFAELAQYRWPKLRAMEISGPEGSSIQVSGDVHVLVEYEDRVKSDPAETPASA